MDKREALQRKYFPQVSKMLDACRILNAESERSPKPPEGEPFYLDEQWILNRASSILAVRAGDQLIKDITRAENKKKEQG